MGAKLHGMKQVLDENRINALIDLLGDYGQGNFERQIEMSPNHDELDSIIGGVNMLGEELIEKSVSKNYFESIFNAVTHPLIVINEKGLIDTTNSKAKDTFSFQSGKYIYDCHAIFTKDLFEKLINQIQNKTDNKIDERIEWMNNGAIEYFSCLFSKIKNSVEVEPRYIVSIKDITEFVNHEQEILKVVIETQERERNRLAKDLHDSLGQELAAMKLIVSHFSSMKDEVGFEEGRSTISTYLDRSIQNLREICYDLTPNVIEKTGLKNSLKEMILRIKGINDLKISLNCDIDENDISINKQLVIYRIIQEFITNSLKHSDAKKIDINIDSSNDQCKIELSDNGKGCDVEKALKSGGSGLTNIISRILAYHGKYIFDSEKNKGFKLTIKI